MSIVNEKEEKLKELLRGYAPLGIAFSGGVDSTYLLWVAYETLGADVCAVTAFSAFVPEREQDDAVSFCEERGIPQITVHADIDEIPRFAENPPDRCYYCKTALFSKMKEAAAAQGFGRIAEGSNKDDEGDYRPGLKAITELGVASPLREAGFTKAEIRERSKALGLPTFAKPSFACLASRFVYGERITKEKLAMVEQAEQYLMDLGFTQFRVRLHGTMARIEVLPEDIGRLMEEGVREPLYKAMKEMGFSYVAADLRGYRTGSMNEQIPVSE